MKTNTTCTCTPIKLCYSCFVESFNHNLNNPIKSSKSTKKTNKNGVIYNKICVVCENEFTTATKNKISCSPECAYERQKTKVLNFQKTKREQAKNNI